jgi:serine/threonine-protein kinase
VEVAGYRLVEKLREGAQSALYLTDGGAVLKLIRSYFRQGVDVQLAAVEQAAAIGHPGIISIEKTGKLDDETGSGFVVMPWLDGTDLNELLRTGPITADLALSLMRQMVAALGAAHHAGLRHGTICPQHFVVGTDEWVTLIDFGSGLACEAYNQAPRDMEQPGILARPVEYLSPEECRGTTVVDTRADLYSLGCVFYQLFARKAPFTNPDGPWAETVLSHLQSPPPPLPANTPLAPLIMAMLEKDPAKRPSCDEIAVELDRFYATSGR